MEGGMGIFNVQEVVEAFRSGDLEKVIKQYDKNDLAYLKFELEGYLEKHDISEENEGLMEKIEALLEAEK